MAPRFFLALVAWAPLGPEVASFTRGTPSRAPLLLPAPRVARPLFPSRLLERRTRLLGAKEATDAEVLNAVEVAFEELENESSRPPSSREGSGDGSPDEAEVKKRVATALGVSSSNKFETSSATLKRVAELSEQAGLAYVKARDYLEYLKFSVEDRAKRDVTLFVATVEYVRQRSVVDTRRVLAAAADATRPLILLAEAAGDPSKRSNLTLSEGLVLLQVCAMRVKGAVAGCSSPI